MATQPITDNRDPRLEVWSAHSERQLQIVAGDIVALDSDMKSYATYAIATRRRFEANQGLPVNPSPRMIMHRLDAIIYGLPRSQTRNLGLGQDARHYRGNLTGSASAAAKKNRAADIRETVQLFAFTPFEDTAREIYKITLRDGSRLTDEDIQRMIGLLVDLLIAIRSQRS